MVNPYAPPAPAPAVVAQAPLPPGMRRYRLSRRPYLAIVRRIVLRQIVVLGVLFAMLYGWIALADLPVVLPGWIYPIAWAASSILTWLRVRPVAERQLAMFEVVVSPRVVRRVMPMLPIAEVLRPEVARIVETPRGLVLVCHTPRRTVSLVRAIEGYDELRAHVASWGPIETMRGARALVFTWGQLGHMRPRDVVQGTALAADASLLDELTTVRALSADAGGGYGSVMNVRRRLLAVLVLWVALIVMFLAIWLLFREPEAPPPAPSRPTLGV